MKIKETEKTFEVVGEVECSSCKGTGLYQGMAERDGAAVVCYDCNGTGKRQINLTYQKFTGRKKREGVKRVYDGSHGYCITTKDVNLEDGTTVHFSKGGVSYKSWLKGGIPKPLKELFCPYQHTDQELQCNDVNNLYRDRCSQAIFPGHYLSKCSLRHEIEKCWKIFEA